MLILDNTYSLAAALQGHTLGIAFLLWAGADPHAKSSSGLTPEEEANSDDV